MTGIPKEYVEEVWVLAKPHLEKAIPYSGYTLDINCLKKDCLSGDLILWMDQNCKAALVLRVSDYHKGKQCDIVILGGSDMKDWLHELKDIEDWADRIGCDRVILTGRKGWQKVLTGYKIDTITMVKI